MMVEWNGWYIDAERVVAVKRYKSPCEGKTRVEIVLDNGNEYTCDYGSEAGAREAARVVAVKIEAQRDTGRVERVLQRIEGQLQMIHAGVTLLDKRQRKLWRRLKEIIPQIGEEAET